MTKSNPRKLRVYNSNIINVVYEDVLQILHKIDGLLEEATEELPPSLIPTETLYDIASTFAVMYEALLKEGLILDGFPKATTNKH